MDHDKLDNWTVTIKLHLYITSAHKQQDLGRIIKVIPHEDKDTIIVQVESGEEILLQVSKYDNENNHLNLDATNVESLEKSLADAIKERSNSSNELKVFDISFKAPQVVAGMEKRILQLIKGLQHVRKKLKQRGDTENINAPLKLLSSLEQYDEWFHKYDIVKYVREKLKNTFEDEKFEQQLKKLCLDIFHGSMKGDKTDKETVFAQKLMNEQRYIQLLDQILNEAKAAVEDISEKSSRASIWSVSSPNTSETTSGKTDFSWDFRANVSASRRKKHADNLHIKNLTNVRRNAIEELEKLSADDIVCNENWDFVISRLSLALGDPTEEIATRVLNLHVRLFRIAPPEATRQIYMSLVYHLIRLFGSQSMASFAKVPDSSDPIFVKTLRKFRLLNRFQHEIPNHWINFIDNISEPFFKETFQLFITKFPLCSVQSERPGSSISLLTSPLTYMCFVDAKASWFHKWIKDSRTRKYVVHAMGEQTGFLERLVNLLCVDFVNLSECEKETNDQEKMKILISKLVESSEVDRYIELVLNRLRIISPEQDTYKTQSMKYLLLLQTISMLGRLLVYDEARRFSFKYGNMQLNHCSVLSAIIHTLTSSFSNSSLINDRQYKLLIQEIKDALCYIAAANNHAYTQSHIDQCILPLKYMIALSSNTRYSKKTVLSQCSSDGMIAIAEVLKRITIAASTRKLVLHKKCIILDFCTALLTNKFNFETSKEIKCAFIGLLGTLIKYSPTSFFDTPSPVDALIKQEFDVRDNVFDALVQFAWTLEGVCFLRNRDLVEDCVNHVYNTCTQKFEWELYYLLSQLFSVPEGIAGLMRLNKNVVHFTQVFLGNCKNMDWLPREELVCTKQPTSFDPMDLIYLFLCSIHTIRYFLHSRPQLVQSIMNEVIFPKRELKIIHFEEKHEFVLKYFDIVTSHMNSYLMLEEKFKVHQKLVQLQNENRIGDSNTIMITECTFLRHHALNAISTLGGPGEKPEITEKDNRKQEQVINDIMQTLKEWPSEKKQFLLLNEFTELVTKPNLYYEIYSKIISVVISDGGSQHTKFWEKYETFQNKESVSSAQSNLHCGVRLIVNYAQKLSLQCDENSLSAMLVKIHKNIACQEEDDSSFDWFAAIMYLLFGDGEAAYVALETFSKQPESHYLWFKRGQNLYYKINNKQVIPVLIICQLIEHILQEELPDVYASFVLSGLSLAHVVQRWISQFFLNYLDFPDIANVMLMSFVYGADMLVYLCIAMLKDLNANVVSKSDPILPHYSAINWINNFQPLHGFRLCEHLTMIHSFRKKYQNMCRKAMFE